ncbi:NPCBM/NEW2 domain-containing protein [Paenibacillus sp. NAIST15-1]|uniref:NPCBM/NEW2 domain-containing protein n=1 Tax=Paenibacillus sp. NAIST15-1 TaxID=1605994 RepID=UPI00086946DB|nr:NPCBM/NEW2 domain-containing protein [Paenibacillus sp. NAIST15-1]GAV12347.1 alpha-galactosidase [Paenibacillus sp. NAIST15-1]
MNNSRFQKSLAKLLLLFVLCIGLFGFNYSQAFALDNGLAETPPMGWNGWNAFHCDVNAVLVKETAKKMVESGMKEAGYQYVNLDDCWMLSQRDENGNLVPDPAKFPDGIKEVADYVHSLGLKIGIYASAGTTTCAWYPGSLNYEEKDAQSFAEWGIDYLKYDNCGDPQGRPIQERYEKMRDALAATGRDIVFSMSVGGGDDPWLWGKQVGNLWRTIGDISDSYLRMLVVFLKNVELYPYAGPGYWNDADMLEIGNGGMSLEEYRTEFSLWSIMASPLLAGTDLLNASKEIMDIYTNREVIAVNQDPIGLQGRPIKQKNDGSMVLLKPMANGDKAVVFFNSSNAALNVEISLSQLGIPFSVDKKTYTVRNLWAHETVSTTDKISASVPAHGIMMYRISPGTKNEVSTDGFKRVINNDGKEIWVKSLSDGSKMITLVNRTTAATTISAEPEKLGFKHASVYLAEDYWTGQKLSYASKIFSDVEPFSAVTYRVTPGTPNEVPAAVGISFDGPSLIAPGETKTIITTMTNYGRNAVHNLDLKLNVPEGWKVIPGSDTTFKTMPPEGKNNSVKVSWKVTAPQDAEAGWSHLTADVMFDSGGGNQGHVRSGLSVQIPSAPPTENAFLSDMQFFGNVSNGWGPIERDTSVGGNYQGDGKMITLNGKGYEKGLGVHAYSKASFYIGKNFSRFISDIGLDGETHGGSVIFQVWGDGEKLYDSGVMKDNADVQHVNVDVSNVDVLMLEVMDGGVGNGADHADWAGAKLLKEVLVDDIKINGESLSGFDQVTTDYYMTYLEGTISDVPTVEVIPANNDVKVDISPAEQLPGTTVITATSADGSVTKTYKIHFNVTPQLYVSDLPWIYATTGWGTIHRDASVGENPIKLLTDSGIVTYDKGIGTHAISEIIYDIAGRGYGRFQSYVGLDHESHNNDSGSIVFQVWADGELLFDSGTMKRDTLAKFVDVDVSGRKQLKLIVTDAGDGNGNDHADWADAQFIAGNTASEIHTKMNDEDLPTEVTIPDSNQ